MELHRDLNLRFNYCDRNRYWKLEVVIGESCKLNSRCSGKVSRNSFQRMVLLHIRIVSSLIRISIIRYTIQLNQLNNY